MKNKQTRIGLLGAGGRMGQWVKRLLETEYADRATLAAEAGKDGPISQLLDADVIIDFSSPEGVINVLRELESRENIPALVIGSTGWTPNQSKVLENFSCRAPVLLASNFSTGVQALISILKSAAPLLQKLGYTPVLVEKHHRHKKDAPSGTALSLQKVIEPERPDSIQTHSIRAGEVIGDHEVTFYGPADQLTISHSAQDRSIFARGALDAAIWLHSEQLAGKLNPGLLDMQDYFKSR